MGKLTRGERNIKWIEDHCRIPEGKDVGKPVHLRPWQKRDIKKVYDNPHGTRMHIESFGRKNAKTTKAAFLLLLHLVGPEAVPNSQLVSTALSKEQAALLFELAAKIVRMSPSLSPHLGIRDHNKHIYCPDLGTTYKALSSEGKTVLGGSPIFAVHDELGQVKGPRSPLFEAVETGMGAHEHPLSIVISTQAPTDADLLSILIDEALEGDDPKTTISLYTAPMEDDPFKVATIKKANPALGDFLNADEVKRTAKKAKLMPAREPAYRNLILNQRVDAKSMFVSPTVWADNSGPVDESWRDAKVYGGLDLSATNDLTALVLCAKIGGEWQSKCWFWLPGEGLVEKSRADRVPYDTWAKQGYLQTTPGSAIEYAWIAHELRKVFDEHNIVKIAFDRWNWKFLKPWLLEAGFRDHEIDKFFEFGQGYVSMSPALRQLESILLEKQLRHADHPVLKMCAANAVVQTDPAGNRKLAKDKSAGRIDGMVALAMAIGVTDNQAQTYVTGRLRTV